MKKTYQDSVANVAGYTNLKIVLKYLQTISNLTSEQRVSRKGSKIVDLTSKLGLKKDCIESDSSFFSLIFTFGVLLSLTVDQCWRQIF